MRQSIDANIIDMGPLMLATSWTNLVNLCREVPLLKLALKPLHGNLAEVAMEEGLAIQLSRRCLPNHAEGALAASSSPRVIATSVMQLMT